jgi:hypothetical protein
MHKNEDLGLTSDVLVNNLTFLLDVQEYKVCSVIKIKIRILK